METPETATGSAIVDETVEAYRNYDVSPGEPGTLVLVRPDGYIGAVATDPDLVRDYLACVASPASE
ncbi:hypothetical protein [Nocardia thraciensis]